MSKTKCNCFWCQKGISLEEAKERDLVFLSGVIYYATLKLFNCSIDQAEKIRAAAEAGVCRKLIEEEYASDDLCDDLYDFYFDHLDMGDLKKSAVIRKIDSALEVLVHATGCIGGDRRLKETPVLEGKVTPEMFVNYELSNIEFPEEIMTIYKAASNGVPAGEITEVLERIKADLSTGMGFYSPPGKTLH